MRFKYAILNEQNVVISVINTPIERTEDDVVLIDDLDNTLLGATYNRETLEFTRVEREEEEVEPNEFEVLRADVDYLLLLSEV